MIYLCDDNKKISKNIIVSKDKNKMEFILKSIKEKQLSVCTNIIEECFTPKFQNSKTISLDFFKTVEEYNLLREILLSDLSIDSKKNIIENISSFNDFCFFSNQLINNIQIEEIGVFDIDKMLEIKKLSEEIGLLSEASVILSQLDVAKDNYKTLLLSKKYNNL